MLIWNGEVGRTQLGLVLSSQLVGLEAEDLYLSEKVHSKLFLLQFVVYFAMPNQLLLQ